MSSKKRPQKEKLSSGEGTAAPPHSRPSQHWLLAGRAVVDGKNSSPAFSNARHVTSGRPHGALRTNTWVEKRNKWLDTAVAVADGCQPSPVTRRALWDAWNADVARRLPSPELYPHHTLKLARKSGALSITTTGSALRMLASIIRRIVVAHTRLLNACYDDDDESGVYAAAKDVERIVGCAVYSTGGYCGPETESRETTFNPRHTTVSAQDGTRRLHFVTNSDATHVNVCHRSYYYQLTVLDGESGAVFDEDELADGLALIVAHAQAADAACEELAISDEAREELGSVRSLLARMTCLQDDIAADVRRRLCEVSEVNAHTLGQLADGLLTVVLLRPGQAAPDAPASQWLHSCLSLYVVVPDMMHDADADGDAEPTGFECTARVSALAASLAAAQALLTHAFCNEVDDIAAPAAREGTPMPMPTPVSLEIGRPDPRSGAFGGGAAVASATPTQPPAPAQRSLPQSCPHGSSPTATKPIQTLQEEPVSWPAAEQTSEDTRLRRATCSSGRYARPDRCTLLNSGGSAAYLELWLPRKHRVPLLPVAPSVYTPAWQPIALAGAVTLADFCLSVILGAEATAKKSPLLGHRNSSHSVGIGSAEALPRVVFSLLPPEATAPVVQLLLSDAIVRFVQIHRSSSALITGEVRRQARQAALESVADFLQSCWQQNESATPGDVASFGGSRDAGAYADVNITAAVTTRAVAKRTRAPGSLVELVECFTATQVPALLQVRCHVTQERAEKQLSLPLCRTRGRADAGASFPEAANAAALLVAHTTSELPPLFS